jgi:DNA-binding transcriptional ArsR family regulator
MSRRSLSRARAKRPLHSVLFAALGDKTRLALMAKLSTGQPSSIAQLTTGSRLTRQAISKHLRVLQRAGIVHSIRAGREIRFSLDLRPIGEMQDYLDLISRQWDQALARLRAFVED